MNGILKRCSQHYVMKTIQEALTLTTRCFSFIETLTKPSYINNLNRTHNTRLSFGRDVRFFFEKCDGTCNAHGVTNESLFLVVALAESKRNPSLRACNERLNLNLTSLFLDVPFFVTSPQNHHWLP